MRKVVYIDKRAEKELSKFSEIIQDNFFSYINILEEVGFLEFPEARKISGELFEIRIQNKENYRGFYAYIKKEFVVVLYFYKKKTQKAPINNINVAKERLKKYK